jgi:preprotein translocase subunit SecD
MKNFIPVFFLLIAANSFAQSTQPGYRFKVEENKLSLSKLLVDSSISVLKKRLVNEGFKNSTITYNKSKKEFLLQTDSALNEEFINKWLLKQCKVVFYETYSTYGLIDVLMNGPTYRKEAQKKKSFFNILNTPASIENNTRVSNVGIIKISDTAEFTKIKKALKNYLPADCVFAYNNKLVSLKSQAIEVFALKNDATKIHINGILDSAKKITDYRGKPILWIRFNKVGTQKFEVMTTKNVNKPIAIVIDGIVYSAPFVNGPIEGGGVEISGNFSATEAKQLADMISGGYLPIKLSLIE